MGMPGKIVTKGSISTKADSLANQADLKKRSQFLEALEDETQRDYAQILIDQSTCMLGQAGAVTTKEANFLRKWWFNSDDKSGWWKGHSAQEDLEWILRQSLIQSMRLAEEGRQTNPLPVDSYWICDIPTLEVIVTRSPNQITRIILTPSINAEASIIPDGDEDIWVIRQRQATNEAERIVGSATSDQHNVETVRLRKTK